MTAGIAGGLPYPSDNATGVINTDSIQLNFSESVVAGTGNADFNAFSDIQPKLAAAATVAISAVADGATVTVTGFTNASFTGTIAGTTGKFDITAGAGNQTITTAAGADTIVGGNGADNITLGGADGARDVVKYTSTTAAGLALEGGDTITDFQITGTCDMINFAAGALIHGASNEYIGFTTTNATILANQVVITLGDAAFTSTADLSVNANALTIIDALDTTTVTSGDSVVVLMDNGTNTYAWLYAEATGDAAVDTAELTLLATFNGVVDAGYFSAAGLQNTGQSTAITAVGAAVATDYFSIG